MNKTIRNIILILSLIHISATMTQAPANPRSFSCRAGVAVAVFLRHLLPSAPHSDARWYSTGADTGSLKHPMEILGQALWLMMPSR